MSDVGEKFAAMNSPSVTSPVLLIRSSPVN